MKTIEIDDELYHYIAGQTQQIGESASDILRRLLLPQSTEATAVTTESAVADVVVKTASAGVIEQKVFDILSKQDLQAELSVVGRLLPQC